MAVVAARNVEILFDHVRAWTKRFYFTLLQPDRLAAQATNRLHVVTHKQHGAAGMREVAHLPQTLALKSHIANRQHFVDDENLSLEMRGDGKSEPHVHAARVTLHGRIQKLLDFCK